MILDKILIVDDEEVSREYLREIFDEAGLQVVVACDGEEAKLRFEEENPDLVLGQR